MLRFIVNDREVSTDTSPAMPAVDFLRGDRRLHGVRVGCRGPRHRGAALD